MVRWRTETGDAFEGHIMAGEWSKAIELLPKVLENYPSNGQTITLSIYRQQFLELLALRKIPEALELLRDRITPNLTGPDQVEQFTK